MFSTAQAQHNRTVIDLESHAELIEQKVAPIQPVESLEDWEWNWDTITHVLMGADMSNTGEGRKRTRRDEEASSRMHDEGCPNESTSTVPETIPDATGYSDTDEVATGE